MKENVPLVLSYHYLNCPGELKPGATCEMSRFKGHLRWLKDNHYTVVMLSQIVELIREGKPLPPKTAAISFDDGLRDGYKRAYPLLKQYGFPATFFVITCALEGKLPPVIGFQILIQELGADKIRKEILPEFLKGTGYVGLLDPKRYNIREDKKPELEEFRLIKWIFNHFLPVSLQVDFIDEAFNTYLIKSQREYCSEMFIQGGELQEMAKNGIDIASHTHSHPWMPLCGSDDIRLQLSTSRNIISNLLRQPPSIMAWPFGGEVPPKAKLMAEDYYEGAYNYNMGDFKGNLNDPYNLPRQDQSELKIQ